jgi:hypothetical protein
MTAPELNRPAKPPGVPRETRQNAIGDHEFPAVNPFAVKLSP